jgi:hypothetical protein
MGEIQRRGRMGEIQGATATSVGKVVSVVRETRKLKKDRPVIMQLELHRNSGRAHGWQWRTRTTARPGTQAALKGRFGKWLGCRC